ncbi:MAG: LacI family DNA-binding transcriptional regulator [Pseudomonadota bacterium]
MVRETSHQKTKRLPTSYDVAQHAGVSQSAVSRCFKPGASVSRKMRERVMRSVEELGYRPNAIARGLITRRSNMVAVIVSNLRYYPEVLSELSRRLSERGIHVLLFDLDHESDLAKVFDQIWQYQVDGVVAAAYLEPAQLRQFEERHIPLVLYNRSRKDFAVSSVSCDQAQGERELVDMLVNDCGHRTFAVIGGPPDSVVSLQRTESAIRRLRKLGIKQIARDAGDYGYDSGRQAIRRIMESRKRPPSAVICANDMMAIGVVDELRLHLDIDVPGDVSVVGFDGSRAGQWLSYDLATIEQPVESMAEAAVSMLMQRIDNEGLPPERRTFSGVLRTGSTVRLK